MARAPVTYDDLYPGRFIKAGNLQDRKVTLTIKGATLEQLEGEDGIKAKAILAFEETPLQHVAPKTNGWCIREMFGPVLADWVGKRVTFFQSTWNGEPCIRVWGSPDIDKDMEVQVKLPRRKPIRMTLHRTEAKTSAEAAE